MLAQLQTCKQCESHTVCMLHGQNCPHECVLQRSIFEHCTSVHLLVHRSVCMPVCPSVRLPYLLCVWVHVGHQLWKDEHEYERKYQIQDLQQQGGGEGEYWL